MLVNRGHAFTTTVGAFKGIQIDMGLLTTITIQPGGKSAIFQGGTWDQQVIEYLWERGYVASESFICCYL